MSEPKIKIVTCIPRQEHSRKAKLDWLENAIKKTRPDLFITPQEYFGGLVPMPQDRHIELDWIKDKVGALAKQYKSAIGVGAATKHKSGTATEDFMYFDKSGRMVGYHRKFALPSYDDFRTKGAGWLYPETSYQARTTPVEIPGLGLKIGTIFCWEVFSLSIAPAYSFAGVNLIVHPIKFAPRGWLKLKNQDGVRGVVGFDVENKGEDFWIDKLVGISRQQTFCPIAVSCNTWELGEKFMALCGHVDEIVQTTDLKQLPSLKETDHLHEFSVNPKLYEGFDHHFSFIDFKNHTGNEALYHKLGKWTMHMKMRRLEAHLIGGTSRMDCMLSAAVSGRQKASTIKRYTKKQRGG